MSPELQQLTLSMLQATVAPALETTFTQANTLPAVILNPGIPVTQEQPFQIPLPVEGAGMNAKINVTYRLLEVKNGIAKIQESSSGDMGIDLIGLKSTAKITGSGLINYHVGWKLILSRESNEELLMLVDTPKGKGQIQSNTKRTETSRPANATGRP